jgi:hypothetical protein
MRAAYAFFLSVVLAGASFANAEGLATSLSWKGGEAEVLGLSSLPGDVAPFIFSYRIPVESSFIPAEVQKQLKAVILNPLESSPYPKFSRLTKPFGLRVHLRRQGRIIAECKVRYESYSYSLTPNGKRFDAEISPGNAEVGALQNGDSMPDSGICRLRSGKRVIPVAERGDTLNLVYGFPAKVLSSARFKPYRGKVLN